MFLTSRRLRSITWLALCAMLVLALVPTLSRAGAGPDGLLADLCVTGTDRSVPSDAGSPGGTGHATGVHCPLCAAAGGAPIPPSPGVRLVPPRLAEARPPLFLHASRPLEAWRSARSRAPPTPA